MPDFYNRLSITKLYPGIIAWSDNRLLSKKRNQQSIDKSLILSESRVLEVNFIINSATIKYIIINKNFFYLSIKSNKYIN